MSNKITVTANNQIVFEGTSQIAAKYFCRSFGKNNVGTDLQICQDGKPLSMLKAIQNESGEVRLYKQGEPRQHVSKAVQMQIRQIKNTALVETQKYRNQIAEISATAKNKIKKLQDKLNKLEK